MDNTIGGIVQAELNYFGRHKQYHRLEITAGKMLEENLSQFWKGFSYMHTGRVTEAMDLFRSVASMNNTKLPASLGLVVAHKTFQVVDKEAVSQLEATIKAESKACGEISLYHGALFLWLSGKSDKARDLVDKLVKANRSNCAALALRGWIDVTSGREAHISKSLKYFDEAIKVGAGTPQVVDAKFGKAEYLILHNSPEKARDVFNEVLGTYESHIPAVIETAKIAVGLGDWETAVHNCQRALNEDRNCVDAHRIMVLNQLCHVGNNNDAANAIGELIAALDAREPRNHALYYECSLAATRLAGRHTLVLQQTGTLLDRALKLNPNSAAYLTELGYHQVLMFEERDAMKTYRQAMALDETSVAALNGVILCQLLQDQEEEAAQQLEFLQEVQASLGTSAELGYLNGLLATLRKKQGTEIFATLDGPVTNHVNQMKSKIVSEDFFVNLNPDLMLQIIELYIQYGPTKPPRHGDAPAPVLHTCSTILQAITKGAPGMIEAVFMSAKVKYLSGDLDAAKSSVQYCLNKDNTHADAHLLMARIQIDQGNSAGASQSLEVGLSYNFEVRESPMYFLIQSKIHQKEGNLDESLKVLAKAMKLPGVRHATGGGSTANRRRNVSTSVRASVYLELANAFFIVGQQHEAAKVMQDAQSEFSGTSEEQRIQIANAELAMGRGDIEGALSILQKVPPSDSHYVTAKKKMAKIYLEYRKDKRLYTACYQELVEQNQTGHTSLLLGDAYMNIQEPEKAIAIYEAALKKNPRDSVLASKIGQALVKTHDFVKAINYYEAALKTGSQDSLRAELAELYLKLAEYHKCERVLQQAIHREDKRDDLETLQWDVKYTMLLARMHHQMQRVMQVKEELGKAKDLQLVVLKRVSVERPESLKQEQELAAEICADMAKQASTEKAAQLYHEALSYDADNTKATLALAKLHLRQGDHEAARNQLTMVLHKNARDNDATLMMAEVMFRKHEYSSAIFHFQELLEREPEHYEALSRLIDLLRRAGKLAEASQYLEKAASASPRAKTEPGLNYCRGQFHRLQGSINQALRYFNLARKDTTFGVRALYAMLDIYLNPDNETVGGETFSSKDQDTAALETRQADAHQILSELTKRNEQNTRKFKVQSAMAGIVIKTRANIEQALKIFQDILTEDKDYVPAILGLARGYSMLKATPKARHQLQRIMNLDWNSVDAEEFENAWLLLADVYIQGGKHDMAQAPLKSCLAHNKSCSKAWEYMGYIFEKEQAYVNASEFYENAWVYSNEKNHTIGYKLAFNFLKAKKYAEAIDICNAILRENPDYPKIRRDILAKARASIRL